jgi:predicted RecB family nuclease
MLTKSLFMAAEGCPRRMWLRRHRPDLAPPDAAAQWRREAGVRVGELAREAFGPGVLIEGRDEEARAAETRRQAGAGAERLHEATFVADGLAARSDVLVREGSGWRIVEAKMAGSVKDYHVRDLAFQAHVAIASGWTIVGASVATLDRDYRLGDDGVIDPVALFALTDLTEGVQDNAAAVAAEAAGLLAVLQQPDQPEAPLGTHCAPCGFFSHCWKGRDTSLLTLPGLRHGRLAEFRSNGWESILDLPDEARLTPAQSRVRDVVRFHRPYIGEGLGEALAGIRFPARFIDFEAAMPELPLMPGHACYEPLPFQWSCHTLAESVAEPCHSAFLHDGQGDPRAEFVETLASAVGGEGSLLHWGSYEPQQLRALAARGVPGAAELAEEWARRAVDMLPLVKEHLYLEEFRGSYSIKAVLPALVPDLSYAGMEVADGEAAVRAYLRQRGLPLDDPERASLRSALEDYCQLDTLAMVRVFQALRALSA